MIGGTNGCWQDFVGSGARREGEGGVSVVPFCTHPLTSMAEQEGDMALSCRSVCISVLGGSRFCSLEDAGAQPLKRGARHQPATQFTGKHIEGKEGRGVFVQAH